MGMRMENSKKTIESGKAVLGIEFGSTRIKAVLIDETYKPIASGDHVWENRLEDGIWTYTLDDIWTGLQDSYQNLAADVQKQYGVSLKKVASIGFSAMMHGYMAFDQEGELLVPFRTWRNGITQQAAEILTEKFRYNIPQRWSIAHLYQAILKEESHIDKIAFFTTLAGYVHWKLTGEKVLGIGDASGMFPIDMEKKNYDAEKLQIFDALIADRNLPWTLEQILPKVLLAGENAGVLTEEGARLLDVSGQLEAGIPLCPPEGDAGTGMVATNSVRQRTGNVSAGTSIFGMVVLEKALEKVYPQIDLVTTPDGSLVEMVHANNCTSDVNAWISLIRDALERFGVKPDTNKLYTTLFLASLEGDKDCGGLLPYGYLSGENITDVPEGRPLFVRFPESRFTLPNFMKSHLYTALGALKVGMDILLKEEKVEVDRIYGHGGFFKTACVGQGYLAAAINAPVTVMKTAGEGGPWGMALLAAYMLQKQETETLEDFLADKVFAGDQGTTMNPDPKDVQGFETFIEQYKKGIVIEKAAVDTLTE